MSQHLTFSTAKAVKMRATKSKVQTFCLEAILGQASCQRSCHWNEQILDFIDSKRWLRRMIMLCCKEREFEADECVKAHDVCYEGPRQNFPPPLRGLQQPPAPFPCKLLLAGEISFSGDGSAPLPFTCSGGVFQEKSKIEL
ncbi:uncharacterized protein LOC111497069 [Cucurbita maxima]|uniref:Uncharacterized protein LOC111497069 n=1 Tax=Cucurbita maxima TaxID=3661 RepID=A0A6J1KTE3_CUCMA|nr:uncharacterized protein LOC111497069 [Cucurbita maxima]